MTETEQMNDHWTDERSPSNSNAASRRRGRQGIGREHHISFREFPGVVSQLILLILGKLPKGIRTHHFIVVRPYQKSTSIIVSHTQGFTNTLTPFFTKKVRNVNSYNSGSPQMGFTLQPLSSYTHYKFHPIHSSFVTLNLAHTDMA
ncbi:hypothetical protein M9H77_19670 [Catharanthus roseus]|uniref:Uncharacterized protein n=1 Tax=Catharanthus roseus TaxID=4058 RepID=A0ACC0BB28_CATRO|nr:hypothetical protein M9H77_19670 [Catharanthus roseus]